MSGTINFAIPKGSLEKATFEILERAYNDKKKFTEKFIDL